MKDPSIFTALRSIRTQFGLVTACTLLGLLSTFYVGGRFILVHMIRQAEQDIQLVGNGIRTVVYGELGALQKEAAKTAETLSRSAEDITHDLLLAQLGSASEKTSVHLAVVLTADGHFKNGCSLLPGETPQPVEANDLQPYLAAHSPLLPALSSGQSASGVINFRQKPLLFASAPIDAPAGAVSAYVVIGTLFHNPLLVGRINTATHGMEVAVSKQPVRQAPLTEKGGLSRTQLAPVLQDTSSLSSGSHWRLEKNTFEAVLPVSDILGTEVTSISIRLPGNFSSLASITLGWLTSFTAFVGILFVLPIFWLQTRIVLNPLSKLSQQIREIGEHHLDGNCAALHWSKRNEFGVLAQSVNEMLAALASKTRQITQSEQRQRALIAGMPDCLCVFDAQANVVTIHKQPDLAHPIPGLIAGRPIAPPLFPDTDCEALRKSVEEAFRTERIQMVIVSCREADGSYRHFETRISRMDSFFALVILRDVTKEWRERETREQVEDRLAKVQKMESLGTLAAGIAHDFNNILSIIQNTVDATWQSPAASEHEAVGTIRQATVKGAKLTRELMTYAGHTRIALRPEDPNAIILDMEKLMGGVVANNVILELKLTPGLPPVDADPHQFWKVIINLLKNASESMNGSSGHIRISTYPLTLTPENLGDFFSTHVLSLGRGVVFQIDDTGSGIPSAVIDRMFEPFFSTKAVGRGLGLATVFGIVDSHNGGIAIDSEVGKGTSFRVWLPAAEGQPAPAAPAAPSPAHAAAPAAEKARETRPCVLLVEDDRSILQSTTIVLRSLHVETLAAASKREALALFRKHADSVNLILLDAQTAHLDNVRLLTALRLRRPGVPAVIVSGHSEDKIRQMFESEPFDGFLSKPYTRGELKEVIEQFATRLT